MQLIDYIPEFVHITKEFEKLFNALQPEVNNLFEEAENRLIDMFVLGCGEYATQRYEKIVGIVPKLTDSLEKRQIDILAIYNEVPPFTYERLEEMLTAIVGVNGFKMYLDIPKYYLKIILKRDKLPFVTEINDMLERIVPVNIILDYSIDWNTWADLKPFTWKTMNTATWKEAREDEKFNSINWEDS